ncbi:hypothetical protein EI555_015198, partial [Monodon monoceros]
ARPTLGKKAGLAAAARPRSLPGRWACALLPPGPPGPRGGHTHLAGAGAGCPTFRGGHRGMKPNARDFCSKGQADGPHPSLRAWGYLNGKRYALTCENKQVKRGLSILKFLEAAQLPKKVAGTNCRDQQKGDTELIRGNNEADTAAKRAALEPVSNLSTTLIPRRPDPSNYSSVYTKEESDKVPKWGFSRNLGGHLVNKGHASFPKLRLVKTSGKFNKEFSNGVKPCIIDFAAAVAAGEYFSSPRDAQKNGDTYSWSTGTLTSTADSPEPYHPSANSPMTSDLKTSKPFAYKKQETSTTSYCTIPPFLNLTITPSITILEFTVNILMPSLPSAVQASIICFNIKQTIILTPVTSRRKALNNRRGHKEKAMQKRNKTKILPSILSFDTYIAVQSHSVLPSRDDTFTQRLRAQVRLAQWRRTGARGKEAPVPGAPGRAGLGWAPGAYLGSRAAGAWGSGSSSREAVARVRAAAAVPPGLRWGFAQTLSRGLRQPGRWRRQRRLRRRRQLGAAPELSNSCGRGAEAPAATRALSACAPCLAQDVFPKSGVLRAVQSEEHSRSEFPIGTAKLYVINCIMTVLSASLRSSVITWRSTAPPLHRTYVTSPSRPGGKTKAEHAEKREVDTNYKNPEPTANEDGNYDLCRIGKYNVLSGLGPATNNPYRKPNYVSDKDICAGKQELKQEEHPEEVHGRKETKNPQQTNKTTNLLVKDDTTCEKFACFERNLKKEFDVKLKEYGDVFLEIIRHNTINANATVRMEDRDIEDAIGIIIKSDFNLRNTMGGRRHACEFKVAKQVVILGHGTLTFINLNEYTELVARLGILKGFLDRVQCVTEQVSIQFFKSGTGPVLHIRLDNSIVKSSSSEAFDIRNRVGEIHCDLVLCSITNQSFGISKVSFFKNKHNNNNFMMFKKLQAQQGATQLTEFILSKQKYLDNCQMQSA